MKYILLDAAYAQLDDIYEYTKSNWSEEQARKYTGGLFDCFADIANKALVWRRIPARLNTDGYFTKYKKHYVYWKVRKDKKIAIVAILHERMHQVEWLQDPLD